MPRTTLDGWLCYRCEHKWVPRDEETPRVCPKCKSPYWDIQRRGKQGVIKTKRKSNDSIIKTQKVKA